MYGQQDALNHYDDLITQSDISHSNGHDMTASKSFSTQCEYTFDDELYWLNLVCEGGRKWYDRIECQLNHVCLCVRNIRNGIKFLFTSSHFGATLFLRILYDSTLRSLAIYTQRSVCFSQILTLLKLNWLVDKIHSNWSSTLHTNTTNDSHIQKKPHWMGAQSRIMLKNESSLHFNATGSLICMKIDSVC